MYQRVKSASHFLPKTYKRVKSAKIKEKQIEHSEEEFLIQSKSSEEISNSAEPSQKEVCERANGAEPESQGNAAAGRNGCSFCSRSYREKKALNRHIRIYHLDEWEKMENEKKEA